MNSILFFCSDLIENVAFNHPIISYIKLFYTYKAMKLKYKAMYCNECLEDVAVV